MSLKENKLTVEWNMLCQLRAFGHECLLFCDWSFSKFPEIHWLRLELKHLKLWKLVSVNQGENYFKFNQNLQELYDRMNHHYTDTNFIATNLFIFMFNPKNCFFKKCSFELISVKIENIDLKVILHKCVPTTKGGRYEKSFYFQELFWSWRSAMSVETPIHIL